MTYTLSLNLSHDDIGYLLELLNNERYSANTECARATSLIAQIVAAESCAASEAAKEDAYWSARDAALSEEEVDARYQYERQMTADI